MKKIRLLLGDADSPTPEVVRTIKFESGNELSRMEAEDTLFRWIEELLSEGRYEDDNEG